MLNNNNKKSEFLNEKDAWEQLQKGSLEALGFFYDCYVDDLFRFGISIKGDSALIQDIIHDMFLELYSYHSKLSTVSNIKAYLISSFRRKLFKNISSKEVILEKNEIENRANALESISSTETEIIDLEQVSIQKMKVKKAWDSLTAHQIKALELKFAEKKSYEEIADDLNVSISSARTLIYRSMKEIRKKAVSLLF